MKRLLCPHALFLGALLLLGAAAGVRAQEDYAGGSFLPPFPDKDIYQVKVVGDSLAEGLARGMVETFAGDGRVQIDRKVVSLPGLMRANFEAELEQLAEALDGQGAHIAVVMVGAWDRTSVRGKDGQRFYPDSEEWKAEYARRADRLVRLLKQKKLAVYWVGLPIMRRPAANATVQVMNEVARQRVYLAGQKFIDISASFTGEDGGYSPYGPDIGGKTRLLREGDGIHFTDPGNQKLASFAGREIKRDLTAAKAERAIPLAGDEEEQARVGRAAGGGAAPGPKGAGAPAPGPAKEVPHKPGEAGGPPAPPQAGAPIEEQKAANGRITLRLPGKDGKSEELETVEIVRPAIPTSVLALVTRRESPDRPSQMGDTLAGQIPGGLTVMSSITPAGGRTRTSPTQSPYYRVLVRGERVTPRPGRVDDARWPRPDATPPPPPPQRAVGRFAQPAAGVAADAPEGALKPSK